MFGNLAVEYDLILGPDGIDPWLNRITRESMFSSLLIFIFMISIFFLLSMSSP